MKKSSTFPPSPTARSRTPGDTPRGSRLAPRLICAALLAAMGHAAPAAGDTVATPPDGPGPAPDAAGRPKGLPLAADGDEKWNAGWTVAVDNDLFGLGNRDYDYTGGLAVTFAGRRAAEWPLSLDRPLAFVDRAITGGSAPAARGTAAGATDFVLHSLQVGVIAFTPDDLESRAPVLDDRPYASLVYLSSGRVVVRDARDAVLASSLTVGMLGLRVAETLHVGLHEAIDADEIPRGYRWQVADGGEPTLRYTLARQALLSSNFQAARHEYELKWTAGASVGYVTEASVALSGRWGRIATPWWSFAPERAEYTIEPAPVIGGQDIRPGTRELYGWLGARVRVRAYNALLQGQFRGSAVTVRSSDLERVIGEAWAGVTWQFSETFRLSYVLRYQTREIESGPGARSLAWGGLLISRDL